MTQARKHRGMRSQKVVAKWFEENGWDYAESTGAGRSGVDVTGLPGLACEVKARAKLEPQAWLRQADREQGLPFVVFRLNGVGEAHVGQWGVMLRLDVFTELLHEAGYGDSPAEEGSLAQQNDGNEPAEDDQAGSADPDDRPDPLAEGHLLTEEGIEKVLHADQRKPRRAAPAVD